MSPRSTSRLLLIGFLLETAACGSAAKTDVLVRFVVPEGAPRPEFLLVTWRGPESLSLSDLRLPRSGTLSQVKPEVATLRVEIDVGLPGERTIVARGMRGSESVSVAAGRALWEPGQLRELVLSLVETLPDTDGDGIPDAADDDCDGIGRRAACPLPDAGVPSAAADAAIAPDLPARDVPTDPAPERAPEPAERPLVERPAPDVTPDTARPPDAAPDGPRPPACPCTLWPPATTAPIPATIDPAGTAGLEAGVRFRSDLDGRITGLRFFKGPMDTGRHVANLWNNAGGLLATAIFAAESPSGWQQVSFPTPVRITAGTAYVASYHTSSGYYSITPDFFGNVGVDNPPLHALRDGAQGPNGVFMYGPSAFPSQAYRSSNYWIDVVFAP